MKKQEDISEKNSDFFDEFQRKVASIDDRENQRTQTLNLPTTEQPQVETNNNGRLGVHKNRWYFVNSWKPYYFSPPISLNM